MHRFFRILEKNIIPSIMWVCLPDWVCLWWTAKSSESSELPVVSPSTWERITGPEQHLLTIWIEAQGHVHGRWNSPPIISLPCEDWTLPLLSVQLTYPWDGQSCGTKASTHHSHTEKNPCGSCELPFYCITHFNLYSFYWNIVYIQKEKKGPFLVYWVLTDVPPF